MAKAGVEGSILFVRPILTRPIAGAVFTGPYAYGGLDSRSQGDLFRPDLLARFCAA